jgi:hypothetical protein
MSVYIRPFRFAKIRIGRRGRTRVDLGPRWLRLWGGAGGRGVSDRGRAGVRLPAAPVAGEAVTVTGHEPAWEQSGVSTWTAGAPGGLVLAVTREPLGRWLPTVYTLRRAVRPVWRGDLCETREDAQAACAAQIPARWRA